MESKVKMRLREDRLSADSGSIGQKSAEIWTVQAFAADPL
jgi:hypothetical protein